MSLPSTVPRLRFDPEAVVTTAFAQKGMQSLLAELRCASDAYLVGGAVRDVIRGLVPQDLDLLICNNDERTHQVLAKFGVAKRNRHLNWRYYIGSRDHVDVIEPQFFYRRFNHACEVLRYFDASVNAIGINLRTSEVLDPLDGLHHLHDGHVWLPPARWQCMNDFESVHLTLRLTRLLERTELRVLNPQAALMHLAKYDTVPWDDLARLNGVTRAAGRQRFLTSMCNRRTVPTPHVDDAAHRARGGTWECLDWLSTGLITESAHAEIHRFLH